jgi:hypothetical protein
VARTSTPTAPVGSKSARVRAFLADPAFLAEFSAPDPVSGLRRSPIAEAARRVGIGYAFAYGIAVRAGVAQSAAARRPEPNAKLRAIVSAVQPSWSADRVGRAVSAIVAGRPVGK